ncbi:unnamed protein product, partial [Darwinula stevensoni]
MSQRNHGRRPIQEVPVSGSTSKAKDHVSYSKPDGEKLGESKFKEACAKIQASVQEYLEKHGDILDSSSEDEDPDEKNQGDGTSVLESIMEKYSQSGGEDLGKTRQFLQDAFKSGTNVCLICIASVKRVEPIWSCQTCYSSFHLHCIQKWAKDSVFIQSESLQERETKASLEWFCPKCRTSYSQKQIPQEYYCFCGKETNPENHPWILPHSCGSLCERPLQPKCGHLCLLLCHPGPCPPCPKIVRTPCYCGGMGPTVRRCCNKEWSCQKSCKNLLACGQHKCEELCHAGACPPCPRTSIQKCNCGQRTAQRPCAEPNWQCDKVCGRMYNCGYHRCDTMCHKGDCGDCPLLGQRTCPCGKTTMFLPCTEDVPPCGDTCGKLLQCGIHQCSARCHRGPCGNVSDKQCRCGSKHKEVPCSKEFICDTKCKRMRDCRRHVCNRKCCPGDCPSCEQACGRTLSCRNHKCQSRCHHGPCFPCSQLVELKCRCMRTSIRVPCGREKSTRPPRCPLPCQLPPPCHHLQLIPHRCHFGSCPPCKLICDKVLPCSHKCLANCHSAVLVQVKDVHKAEGPWDSRVKPRQEVQELPCPPC